MLAVDVKLWILAGLFPLYIKVSPAVRDTAGTAYVLYALLEMISPILYRAL